MNENISWIIWAWHLQFCLFWCSILLRSLVLDSRGQSGRTWLCEWLSFFNISFLTWPCCFLRFSFSSSWGPYFSGSTLRRIYLNFSLIVWMQAFCFLSFLIFFPVSWFSFTVIAWLSFGCRIRYLFDVIIFEFLRLGSNDQDKA